MMTERAMQIAASMKLTVIPDETGKFDGVCLIEACLNQLIRSQFDMPDNDNVQYWREKVVNIIEHNEKAYNLFTAEDVKKAKLQQ